MPKQTSTADSFLTQRHGAAEPQPKERGQQSGTGVSPVCFCNRRQLGWNTQARRLCHCLAGKIFAERRNGHESKDVHSIGNQKEQSFVPIRTISCGYAVMIRGISMFFSANRWISTLNFSFKSCLNFSAANFSTGFSPGLKISPWA
jgi:hypothetical protein